MIGKAALILLFAMIFMVSWSSAQIGSRPGNCPMAGRNQKCMPRCTSDWQCSFNDKCCPNICGSTSCVSASSIGYGNDYNSKNSYDAEVYCDGVKCSKYEKCSYDSKTKRQRCVRT